MKNFTKRMLHSLLVFSLVFTLTATELTPMAQATVTQADIDALKEDASDLDDQKAAIAAELASLSASQSEISQRKTLLDSQIALLEQETDNLEQQIIGYDALIVQAQEELEVAQEEEAEQYDLFCNRVRAMEKNGTVSYWSVIFAAEDFSDMLSRLDTVNEIMDADQAVIDNLKALQADIDAQAMVLNASRDAASLTQDELDERVAELNVQLQEQEALMQEVMSDQASLQSIYDEMADEEARVQAEIMEKSAQLAAQNTGTATTGGYIWPVDSRRITSPFGPRNTGIAGASTYHNGVDIGGVYYNSSVYATKAGTVITSTYSSSYGNYVVVSHGNGNTTLYAHMSSRKVSVGQEVAQGDVLGITGSTGISSGPHLHFEISENGERLDPLTYLGGYIEAW